MVGFILLFTEVFLNSVNNLYFTPCFSTDFKHTVFPLINTSGAYLISKL